MYKKPITEVNVVETDYMLLDPVSFGAGGGSIPPKPGMPKRGEVIN